MKKLTEDEIKATKELARLKQDEIDTKVKQSETNSSN
jgi:hypothetical protein